MLTRRQGLTNPLKLNSLGDQSWDHHQIISNHHCNRLSNTTVCNNMVASKIWVISMEEAMISLLITMAEDVVVEAAGEAEAVAVVVEVEVDLKMMVVDSTLAGGAVEMEGMVHLTVTTAQSAQSKGNEAHLTTILITILVAVMIVLDVDEAVDEVDGDVAIGAAVVTEATMAIITSYVYHATWIKIF